MAKPANLIGGTLLAIALFLTFVINLQFVRFYLWLLMVPIVGFFAGIFLGAAMNARDRTTGADMLTYTGLFGAGVILVSIYFWMFSRASVEANRVLGTFDAVMWMNLLNGILMFLGTTLVSLPERSTY